MIRPAAACAAAAALATSLGFSVPLAACGGGSTATSRSSASPNGDVVRGRPLDQVDLAAQHTLLTTTSHQRATMTIGVNAHGVTGVSTRVLPQLTSGSLNATEDVTVVDPDHVSSRLQLTAPASSSVLAVDDGCTGQFSLDGGTTWSTADTEGRRLARLGMDEVTGTAPEPPVTWTDLGVEQRDGVASHHLHTTQKTTSGGASLSDTHDEWVASATGRYVEVEDAVDQTLTLADAPPELWATPGTAPTGTVTAHTTVMIAFDQYGAKVSLPQRGAGNPSVSLPTAIDGLLSWITTETCGAPPTPGGNLV